MNYSDDDIPSVEELLRLYEDAEWTSYTSDPGRLTEALKNSAYVVTARDNGLLVGLVRCISDGKTIAYVQDILVLKSRKRLGIGKELMRKVQTKYEDLRQLVLLTDNAEEQRAFYEACGFADAQEKSLRCFVRLR